MRKKKYTPLLASIHDAGDGIRKLRISSYRGDPQRTATETKAAIAKQAKVVDLTKQFAGASSNLELRKKASDAANELEALLPQQVKKKKTKRQKTEFILGSARKGTGKRKRRSEIVGQPR